MNNTGLASAKSGKNDEFYTQLSDIQAELKNYNDKFINKTVICNCDDPFESNFVKYFLMNFNRLGLKELIATGYKTSSFGGDEFTSANNPYVLRVCSTKKYLVGTQKDLDVAGAKYFLETEGNNVIFPLMGNYALDKYGNRIQIQEKETYIDETTGKKKSKTIKKDLYYEAGDFRSDMSIQLLKESDIVVTNPPFSLFREYVAQLVKYNKQFLIIGNVNAITYKEIFPLIKSNQLWFGPSINSGDRKFYVPNSYSLQAAGCGVDSNGKKFIRVKGVRWYTNLDHQKRHQLIPLDLGFTYKGHEDMYPKYDNYDAINVDKTTEIPCDYLKIIGVPITFLDSFCPDQFEIVGLSSEGNDEIRSHNDEYYDGYEWSYGKNKEKKHRLSSWMPLLLTNEKGGTLCKKEGFPDLYQLYWRVFIRFTKDYIKSHPEQFNDGGK